MAGKLTEKEKKWFEFFKKAFVKAGFDLGNHFDFMRLRQLENKIDELGQEYFDISNVLDSSPNYDVDELFNNKKSINDLSEEEIKKLYHLSMNDQLFIIPKDKSFMELEPVTYNDNDEVIIGVNPDLLAVEPNDKPAINNTHLNDSGRGSINLDLTDVSAVSLEGKSYAQRNEELVKTLGNIHNSFSIHATKGGLDVGVKNQWQALILDDKNNFPEFYATKELSDKRSAIIKDKALADYAEMFDEFVSENERKRVKKASENVDIEGMLQIKKSIDDLSNRTGVFIDFKTAIEGGLITDGNGNLYKLSNGEPWDTYGEIASTINDGKPIFMSVPNRETGELESYKFKLSGEGDIKFEKNTVKLAKKFDTENVKDKLTSINNYLNQLGTTRGDSVEYKQMKATLDETIQMLNGNLTEEQFENQLKKLHDKANDYHFAKIDQSQNKTRRERFLLSDAIMEIAETPGIVKKTKSDFVKEDIAEKILKSIALELQKSKDVDKKAEGNKLLEDMEYFRAKKNEILSSPGFKELYEGKTVAQLEKSFFQKPKDIVKALKASEKTVNERINQQRIAEGKERIKPENIERIKHYIKAGNELQPNSDPFKDMFQGKPKDDAEKAKINERVLKLKNNKYDIGVERSGLVTLAACKMMEKGYSLDEIYDNSKLYDEKKKAFDEVADLVMVDGKEKEVAGLYVLGVEKFESYMNKIMKNIDLSDPTFTFKKDTYKIHPIAYAIVDAYQEAEKNSKVRAEFKKLIAGKGVEGAEKEKIYYKKSMGEVYGANFIKVVAQGTIDAVTLYDAKPTSEHHPVLAQSFVKTVIVSKCLRDDYQRQINQNPGKSFTELQSVSPEGTEGTAVANAMDIVNEKYRGIEVGDQCKNLSKSVLSGEFDRSYKVNLQLEKNPDNNRDMCTDVSFRGLTNAFDKAFLPSPEKDIPNPQVEQPKIDAPQIKLN